MRQEMFVFVQEALEGIVATVKIPNDMKNIILAAAFSALTAASAFAEDIKIGVTPGPHAQIMEKVGSVIGTANIHLPTRKLSTDNSLMIALAGYFKILRNPEAVYENIVADGNWEL